MPRPPLDSFFIQQNAPQVSSQAAQQRPPLDSFFVAPQSSQQPAPNSFTDYAMAIPTGITKGVLATISAPRELSDLAAAGVGYFTGRKEASLGRDLGLPSYRDVESGFENAVGNIGRNVFGNKGKAEIPNAQGSVPKMLEMGGSFVGVPAGSIASNAARFIGGMASEAAGQATKGTKLEIPARIIAGVGGTYLGQKAADGFVRGMKGQAPSMPKTVEQLTEAKDKLYQAAENSGTAYDKAKLAQVADAAEAELVRKGYSPNNHTYTANLLERIREGQNTTLPGVDSLRQSAYQAPAGADAKFSKIIGSKIGDFMASDTNLAAGTPAEGIALNRQAREANKVLEASKLASELENAISTRARGTTSQTAATNFIRDLAADKDRMKFLSKPAQDAIEAGARTGNGQRALMMLGSLGPNRLMGAVNLGASLSNPALLGLNAVGMGAQVGDKAITASKVGRIKEQLRGPTPSIPERVGSAVGDILGTKNAAGAGGPPPASGVGKTLTTVGTQSGISQNMNATPPAQGINAKGTSGSIDPRLARTLGMGAAAAGAAVAGTEAYQRATGKETYVQQFLDKIRHAESGGHNTAKSKTSSAYGPFQFTRGVWDRMIEKYGSEELKKHPDRQSLRSEPELATYMAKKLAEENAGYLERKNIPVNGKTLYVAHFAGGPRAARMYVANKNAPAEKFFAPFEVAANRSILQGKTIGQVIKTLEAKV